MDFYSMQNKKPSEQKAASTEPGTYWWRDWDKETSKPFEGITAALKQMDQLQLGRQQLNLRNLRLYANSDITGLNLQGYWRTESGGFKPNKIALNVIQACVDTVAAKIAKSRPRMSFQTFGGDFGKQQKAKRLNRFCQGAFYEANVYQHSQLAFVQAGVWGDGFLHPYEDARGRIAVEAVAAPELRVDDAEAIHGEPRQLHRVKHVPRELLLELFPDDAQTIKDARAADTGSLQHLGEMILVRQSWHLPSRPVDPEDEDARTDGVQLFSVENGTLGEPTAWTKPYFPFAHFRWKPLPFGFWSQGIAEQLTGIQVEINRLLEEISETLRLVSKGRIFLEEGSKVAPAHVRGGSKAIGDIISYRGTVPTVAALNAVPPEQFAQLDRLYQRAFEAVGVSQLSAGSKKPAGLDSGAALREYNDIESERFALVGQEWERFHMQLARLMIDLACDMATRGAEEDKPAGYAVKVPGKKFLESIDWKDINLDDEAYVMQVFPVSSLPTTPAARVATVQEWIEAGFVDAVEGRRLLEFPDLEASTNLAVAALDDVDATLEEILDKGKYNPPEEYQDLPLLLQRAQSAYLHARHEGVPEERLDLLRQLVDDTAALMERKKAEAAAAAPPAPPMGAGMSPAPAGPPGVLPPAPPPPLLQ